MLTRAPKRSSSLRGEGILTTKAETLVGLSHISRLLNSSREKLIRYHSRINKLLEVLRISQ